jgi:hypothetical protein
MPFFEDKGWTGIIAPEVSEAFPIALRALLFNWSAMFSGFYRVKQELG